MNAADTVMGIEKQLIKMKEHQGNNFDEKIKAGSKKIYICLFMYFRFSIGLAVKIMCKC